MNLLPVLSVYKAPPKKELKQTPPELLLDMLAQFITNIFNIYRTFKIENFFLIPNNIFIYLIFLKSSYKARRKLSLLCY